MDYCKHCGQFIEEGELVLSTRDGLIHDVCFDQFARGLAWEAGAFLVYGESEHTFIHESTKGTLRADSPGKA